MMSCRPPWSNPYCPVLPIGVYEMKFQHAYSHSFRGSDLECKEPSLTQQQFAEDADINVMMTRFGVTGQMPSSLRMPTFGDFTGVGDYRAAMDMVVRAQNEFMTLPPDMRARFGNDPHQLISFLEDPNNAEEARKLGLLNPAPAVPSAEGEGGKGG